MDTVTPPPMTFEQAMAILREQHANTLVKIEVEKQQQQEEWKKRDGETKKRDEEFRAYWKKRDEEFQAYMKKQDEKMENISNRFGGLGNRLGDIMETLMLPNLTKKFNDFGFTFNNTATNYIIKDGKKTITEIDVVLEDGDSVMIVEIKTKPTIADIEKHIERMDKIQTQPPGFLRDKKLYGAIACSIINDDVKEEVFNAGFFVVCQTFDNIEILPPPEKFVPKYWDTSRNG